LVFFFFFFFLGGRMEDEELLSWEGDYLCVTPSSKVEIDRRPEK